MSYVVDYQEQPIAFGEQEISPELQARLEARLGGPCVITSCTFVVWNSSALGCPEKGGHYCHVMVPGYRIVVEGKGVFHTNIDGRSIVRNPNNL